MLYFSVLKNNNSKLASTPLNYIMEVTKIWKREKTHEEDLMICVPWLKHSWNHKYLRWVDLYEVSKSLGIRCSLKGKNYTREETLKSRIKKYFQKGGRVFK